MEETGRLDSWKQIAAYLGKSERTVRRWQETEGLPVHRHVHQQRGSVWAYRAQLDEWLEQRRESPETPPEHWSRPRPALAAAILATAVLVGAGALLLRPSRVPAPVYEAEQITALPGVSYTPSFSPSGRQIVFHWSAADERKGGLFVKTIGDESVSLLAAGRPGFEFLYSPAWSPDGATIAFLSRVRHDGVRTMYATNSETWLCLIASAGGPARRLKRLAEDVLFYANNNHLSWAHDSRWIFAPMSVGGERGIYRISVDTGEAVPITRGAARDLAPALSPDGRALLFLRQEGPQAASIGRILRQDLSPEGGPEGHPQELITIRSAASGFAWLPSGRELVLCMADSAFYGPFNRRLYRLTARPPGAPVSLGLGGGCSTVSVSAVRRGGVADLIYASGENADARLLRTDLETMREAFPVAPSSRFDAFPAHSPDGSSIAFVSNRSGQLELWTAPAEGGDARRLTSGSNIASLPRWSPDGARLVYGSAGLPGSGFSLPYAVYSVGSSGGTPARIPISQPWPSDPFWSPDGAWIYFWSGSQLWRTRLDGTGAVEIGDFPAHFARPVVIRGGAVYYTRSSEPFALWRAGLNGGEHVLVADGLRSPFFAATDNFVYYTGPPEGSLYARPWSGGPPRRIGSLPAARGFHRTLLGISVSPNDRSVVWGMAGDEQLDLQLVRGLR